ncbi:MAG TPA: 2-phospho-L-lactate guanylyltransferase [Terriglobales bacterium]|jgi:2-phospho-L-lactate/phosphoenolpyruvate guanylyltransferase|nr:2-phospho-L-lactate guanylyltransferase [Terriglobales bacterium]
MILIPVKNLSNAKQRLATVLDAESRTALAQAMLQDVLETVQSWRKESGVSTAVALVTSDPYAEELGRALDFELIRDETNPGETGAIEMATRLCESRGVKSTLVIPGDIPLIAAWELQEIMDQAPAEGTLLVPAADGRGTNAALRNPAGLFPLRFGNDSFKPHFAAAQATGKPCIVLSLPGIALDVDRPGDLQELQLAEGNGHAQKLLRGWNLSDLPMAANE